MQISLKKKRRRFKLGSRISHWLACSHYNTKVRIIHLQYMVLESNLFFGEDWKEEVIEDRIL